MFNGLKKCLPNFKSITNSSLLHGFKSYLSRPALWRVNRDSVSRAVAIGLFSAAIPLMPFQMIIAVFFAVLITANLPIAVAVSWVCNPLTIVPITYFTYSIGNKIVGEPESAAKAFLHKLFNYPYNYASSMLQFGKAFFVGLPIVAIGAAILGYVVVIACWRGSEFLHQHCRRKK
jgi:uncharacterized protein